MTSYESASPSTPQIVRVPPSPLPEAHAQSNEISNDHHTTTNTNSELSDIDVDSDFEYDDEDDPAAHDKFQPELSWTSAAEDVANGIQYVKERFPGDNIPYLPTPFRQEPIKVEVNDKVVVLDEVSEHAVRVRLVRTGEVGIVPMWNVEGPFEKLARQNMLWNEIATSPVSEHPTTINSLRMPQRRYSTDEEPDLDEEELDPDWPLTPTSPVTAFLPSTSSSTSSSFTRRPPLALPSSTIYNSKATSSKSSSTNPFRLKRKVEFSSSPRKMIFRYFPPNDPQSQWDSDSDSESGEPDESHASHSEDSTPKVEEEDSNWWWDGWEEAREEEEEHEEENHIDLDKERERWRELQRQRGYIVA
ncbi:hypothetical protein BDY19DRAFT_993483 [Irpex rosettiformis]|uniref:Uncharacterized protein n=1 Tax=Irpex rosettiformis TaxID=378272 RepID=A0ACB8U4E1_9APHY|nr:hypothetical protein BDY19DRAFT_993483 [Irpex rosettiformis]